MTEEKRFGGTDEVHKLIMDYYNSRPDIYKLGSSGYISTLDESKVVQPVVTGKNMSPTRLPWATKFRDYWQNGNYLGRVTIDEGNLISLELK